MWLYAGVRAALGSARHAGRGSSCLSALVALLALQLLCLPAHAQTTPSEPEPEPQPALHDPTPAPAPDVLHAPPPEPPDDSDVPVVRDKPKPSKPAPKKPEPRKPAPTPPIVQEPKPRVEEPLQPAASTPSAVTLPASADPAAVGPPQDADFSGRGDGSAAAPQEDFESDVQEVRHGFKREYSVRIDTLNWLLLGRLSVELEMSLFKYLTVSMTPVFVTHTAPIAINYAGLDDPLKQHSNGLGPISGVSIGVGAWFWGEPFRGYVLRLELTNYGYTYRTKDAAGTIDSVDFTERRLILFVGSHSRFGPFTFAGGFGLGYELHQVERCGLSVATGDVRAGSSDCKGKQLVALDRRLNDRADANGPLHPVYFQARFSLGVVF